MKKHSASGEGTVRINGKEIARATIESITFRSAADVIAERGLVMKTDYMVWHVKTHKLESAEIPWHEGWAIARAVQMNDVKRTEELIDKLEMKYVREEQDAINE